MKSIPVLTRPKTAVRQLPKVRRRKESPIAKREDERLCLRSQFLHDVANQLTIVGLAAFDLRNTECCAWKDEQLKAFGAIDAAIREAAEIMEKFSTLVAEESKIKNRPIPKIFPNQAPPAKNVYPIFPSAKRP